MLNNKTGGTDVPDGHKCKKNLICKLCNYRLLCIKCKNDCVKNHDLDELSDYYEEYVIP